MKLNFKQALRVAYLPSTQNTHSGLYTALDAIPWFTVKIF
jgi:hypothetical protein